jgi:hypothetical protein
MLASQDIYIIFQNMKIFAQELKITKKVVILLCIYVVYWY